jgi:hypothetical protein
MTECLSQELVGLGITAPRHMKDKLASQQVFQCLLSKEGRQILICIGYWLVDHTLNLHIPVLDDIDDTGSLCPCHPAG